jgi:hypothetical protein
MKRNLHPLFALKLLNHSFKINLFKKYLHCLQEYLFLDQINLQKTNINQAGLNQVIKLLFIIILFCYFNL